MNKVANATCVVCHLIKPRTQMVQRTFREPSGDSFGVSANINRKSSTRVSSRSYRRFQKKWICNECWSKRPNYFLTAIATILFNPIFVPRYKRMSSLGSVLYFCTLGGFFLGWLVTSLQAIFASLDNADGLNETRCRSIGANNGR